MKWCVVVALTGCLKTTAYVCHDDGACTRSGVQGVCQTSVGFCSFPDADCSTGQRYGDLSGSLANQCVDGANLDAGIDTASDGMLPDGLGCPVGYATLSGIPTHSYRRLASAAWTTQRERCRADGANIYLAIPDDATELHAITILAGGDTWVGVDDLAVEGTFVTVLGDPAAFLPWVPGNPDGGGNSDCVLALAASDRYDDRRCGSGAVAVCECEP